MFGSLLIANRGEIACRIMRTARRLGMRTVAVYSDADAHALHVRSADQAVRIGPAPAAESYLRAEAIVEAALRTGAEAVHPGYGFLSERAILPLLCAEAGLAFVGPSAAVIEAMGSKINAKAIAERAGVANVPGYSGRDQSEARLREEARAIGLPLMVKASAGGGGKGMRRVFAMEELGPALDMARREADAAFADPTLLLERLLLRPRHLEVQVAGDRHGNVVHLFERDCSVQRNNQKLLEEAPAPNLADSVRARLLASGVAVAAEIGYDNLGTVEFILDEGQAEPWFLEMNTRLQVEHTVTEAITGQDLVEWQLRIAAGERLPLAQDEIVAKGAAIEARVTAERADQDFRPDAGRIAYLREPEGVRVDSGVAAGSEVTLFYDSLVAKVIAAGPTRELARGRLEAALRSFPLLGPATTLPFLADAVAHPIFRDGRATTRFIEDAFPHGWSPPTRFAETARIAAVLVGAMRRPERQDDGSPWTRLAGFRTLAPAGVPARIFLLVGDRDSSAPYPAQVIAAPGGHWQVVVGEAAHTARLTLMADHFDLALDGERFNGAFHDDGERVDLEIGGGSHSFRVRTELDGAVSGAGSKGQGDVLAPMPGVIAELLVAEGDAVEAGQAVVVLESMKLFVSVKAELAGTVTAVSCRKGETVTAGDRLVTIAPDEADADAA